MNGLQEQAIDWLSEADNQQINAAIVKLQESVQQVRAAGKLAANPQTLLINNERERAGDIGMLVDYAKQAGFQFSDEQTVFLATLAEMGQSLNSLSQQRQAYFEQQGEGQQQALLSENKQFGELLSTLESMPRFEIYTQVNQEALTPEQPDEIGELSISSLQTLTRRYEKEIANTVELQQQVNTSRASLNQQILALQTVLDNAQQQITGIKADITRQVRWAMLAALLFIVIAVAAQALVQKQTIGFLLQTERFFGAMLKGDYRQPMTNTTRITETVSVAESANHLQAYLAELIAKLDTQAETVTNASQSLQSVSASTSALTRQQNAATDQVATAVTELS